MGGATSHTAIVARGLNTPCVAGLHYARELIREDDLLILDGEQGVLIVNPDKLILAEYKLRQNAWELERKKLKRLRTARANTLDGTLIELYANIEKPEDIAEVKENGAPELVCFAANSCFLTAKTFRTRKNSSRRIALSPQAWTTSLSPSVLSIWAVTSN